MWKSHTPRAAVCSLLVLGLLAASLGAAEPSVAELQRQHETMVAKATTFLLNKGRASDGSYSASTGIGVTALVTTALLRSGVPASDSRLAGSIDYLLQHINDDGGIYSKGSLYRNYETCLVILCLTEANDDGQYDQVLKRADAFVKGIQWDESEDKEKGDPGYGGAGYGKHKRPDLSNTSFLIDALKATGNGADSEALQRALVFVSRCQNMESEHNTTPFASKSPDGGFYYTPAAGGTSQAGKTANGGLRSYASMTYAGLKSMIYAGVGPEDKRVKAAYGWIQRHYDLSSNPGMGKAGLYYYYHTFAKALDAMDVDEVEDDQGIKHNWRQELIETLAKNQLPDGSWINENDRWYEGDANLVTGYALLALSYCRVDAADE